MAGTDKTQKFDYRPSPAVILCEPQLGENIGTTARAMANFGLWDLRLVNPRDGWPNEKAIAAASRADHVIEKVRVYPTTEAAIEDLSLVYATTARRRDLQKPVLGPEEASQRVIAHIDTGAKAGILPLNTELVEWPAGVGNGSGGWYLVSRTPVITGQDIPIIVVKCAKVKEEGSPEFSQGERREILAATVCDLGTFFK